MEKPDASCWTKTDKWFKVKFRDTHLSSARPPTKTISKLQPDVVPPREPHDSTKISSFLRRPTETNKESHRRTLPRQNNPQKRDQKWPQDCQYFQVSSFTLHPQNSDRSQTPVCSETFLPAVIPFELPWRCPHAPHPPRARAKTPSVTYDWSASLLYTANLPSTVTRFRTPLPFSCSRCFRARRSCRSSGSSCSSLPLLLFRAANKAAAVCLVSSFTAILLLGACAESEERGKVAGENTA